MKAPKTLTGITLYWTARNGKRMVRHIPMDIPVAKGTPEMGLTVVYQT